MKTELTILQLKQPENEFLRNLVYFGGVCTRVGAEMNYPQRKPWSVTRRMKDFVELGLIDAVRFNFLPSSPYFYVCSRRLARHYGVDRRPTHAIEGLLERQFRFQLSCALRQQTTIGNCHTPDFDMPLEPAATDLVKASRRDEIVDLDNRMVLVDVHPFWPLSLAMSRLHFWNNVAPHLSLQVWSTSKAYCDLLSAKLSPNLRRSVCNFQVVPDIATDNYMLVINRREAQSVDCAGHVHANKLTYTQTTQPMHNSNISKPEQRIVSVT